MRNGPLRFAMIRGIHRGFTVGGSQTLSRCNIKLRKDMGRLKPRGIVPQGLSQVSHGEGQVTLRSHRVKALVRGGWHGPMRGNAKRLASPIGDRCIRHGPITLIPGERPDSNFTHLSAQLRAHLRFEQWSFQASNEVMEVEPPIAAHYLLAFASGNHRWWPSTWAALQA